MNTNGWLSGAVAAACLALLPARAGVAPTARQLDALDRQGYFTPDFKTAVRDLVSAREQLHQAQEQEEKARDELPALQAQAAQAKGKTTALQQELNRYDHPEDSDFAELQARLHDASARPESVIPLAQAFVWAYPASPHEAEAQQALTSLQKKIADQQQAGKDAEADREAAHVDLVRRARAHDLSLAEWRDYLRGMSQDDLVQLLGQPSSKQDDYWFYNGGWAKSSSGSKVGLQINFEAGRVLTVDPKSAAP